MSRVQIGSPDPDEPCRPRLEDEAKAVARQKIDRLASVYDHCVRQPTSIVHWATLEAEMSS